MAEAVAGVHGPICVWGGAGLCSAPWHHRTELPQTALNGFMPFAVGVPFSDNCTNKIVSLCNMCFLLVNPEAPQAFTHTVVVWSRIDIPVCFSLPVVTRRCGPDIRWVLVSGVFLIFCGAFPLSVYLKRAD